MEVHVISNDHNVKMAESTNEVIDKRNTPNSHTQRSKNRSYAKPKKHSQPRTQIRVPTHTPVYTDTVERSTYMASVVIGKF